MMARAFLMGASRWSLAVTRHATTVLLESVRGGKSQNRPQTAAVSRHSIGR